jgi:hypothetical protein
MIGKFGLGPCRNHRYGYLEPRSPTDMMWTDLIPSRIPTLLSITLSWTADKTETCIPRMRSRRHRFPSRAPPLVCLRDGTTEFA